MEAAFLGATTSGSSVSDVVMSWMAQVGTHFTLHELSQSNNPEMVVALVVYVMIEMAFWVYSRWYLHPRLDRLQTPKINHRGDRHLLMKMFEVKHKIKEHYTPECFLTRWFRGKKTTTTCPVLSSYHCCYYYYYYYYYYYHYYH